VVFTDILEEPADLRPPFGVPPLGLNKSRLTR
jgi:hypothetical protein